MSEVTDAVQIVMLTGRSAYMLGYLSIRTAMLIVKVLNTAYLAKWKGATSLNRFRQIKGDDMLFINVSTEDENKLRYIEKELENHGILFARLPDMKYLDGRTQYVIAQSDLAKFRVCLMDHYDGLTKEVKMGPVKPEDYVQTAFENDGTPTREYQDLERSAREQLPRLRAEQEPMRIEMKKRDPTFFHEMHTKIQKEDRPLYEKYWDSDVYEVLRAHENQIIYGTKIHWIAMEPEEEDERGRWAAYRLPDGSCCVIPCEDIYEGKVSIKENKEYYVVDTDGRNLAPVEGAQIVSRILDYGRPGAGAKSRSIPLPEVPPLSKGGR